MGRYFADQSTKADKKVITSSSSDITGKGKSKKKLTEKGRKAQQRASLSTEETDIARQKDKIRKSQSRESLTQ